MRRLPGRLTLALALAGAAFAAAPASASTTCTPGDIRVCVTYTCQDACGPIIVDVQCNLDDHPKILACDIIDDL